MATANVVDVYTLAGFLKHVSNGRMFSVEFVKRTDNTNRVMLARTHVTKGVKGVLPAGQREAEDKAKNLLTVFDMVAYRKNLGLEMPEDVAASKSFRRISLDSLNWIKLGGTKYNYNRETKCFLREGSVVR